MIDIQITDVTTGAINGTGVFDKLMSTVKAHIAEEYDKGRIKGQDYATLYLGSIQSVLQQSIEYVLREKMTEAQIAGVEKETELKEYDLTSIKPKELEIKQKELELRTTESNRMRDMTEAELEKQWGYSVTRNLDGELVLGATIGTGVIDKEILLKEEQKALAYTERIGKDKEVASMGLDNVIKLREADRVNNSAYVYQPAYQG